MNKRILGIMWASLGSLVTTILFIKYSFSDWTFIIGIILLLPSYFLLFRTHNKSWIYVNKACGFKVTIPARWTKGIFLNPYTPQFYGPSGESLKFAIGWISPVPDVETQQKNLEGLAKKCGHTVLDIRSITVFGKEHATMLVEIPTVGKIKNYSLIFNKIEYLVTANVEMADSIVQSFQLI